MDIALEQHRRNIALAQIDAFIDVCSAWRGRYEDDDWHNIIGWLVDIVPQTTPEGAFPREGILCDSAGNPAFGWRLGVSFSVASICRSLRGKDFCSITRRDLRKAAEKSGVSLPSIHATYFLTEKCEFCGGLRIECRRDGGKYARCMIEAFEKLNLDPLTGKQKGKKCRA